MRMWLCRPKGCLRSKRGNSLSFFMNEVDALIRVRVKITLENSKEDFDYTLSSIN